MNYFELFDLPLQFSLDVAVLSDRFRQLQRQFHPDNFVLSNDAEQLQSVQKAAEINDAYQTLKLPVRRAEYLLTLSGRDIKSEQTTLKDLDFLMQQMEWRETLESISDIRDANDELSDFNKKVRKEHCHYLTLLETQLNAKDWANAADIVRKLKFIDKLREEILRLEETLFD